MTQKTGTRRAFRVRKDCGLTRTEDCLPVGHEDWRSLDFTMPPMAPHSGRVRIRKRGQRFGRPLRLVIVAALLGWGLFLANLIYHETAGSDQRAIADCIEQHNRAAVGSNGQDAVAIAAICAQSKANGQ